MDHELRRAEQQERRREKSRTERHLRSQLLEAETMQHLAEQEHEGAVPLNPFEWTCLVFGCM